MSTDDDLRPLEPREIEEAYAAVDRHKGPAPGWITSLLAGKSVQITRSQAAFYAAWKARHGVTDSATSPLDMRQE